MRPLPLRDKIAGVAICAGIVTAGACGMGLGIYLGTRPASTLTGPVVIPIADEQIQPTADEQIQHACVVMYGYALKTHPTGILPQDQWVANCTHDMSARGQGDKLNQLPGIEEDNKTHI